MKLELLKQNIDYDKEVTGKDLDYKTYNQKFAMWDYVIKNGLLDRNDPNALKLLKDLTIYCYAFLRDDNGQPFRMTAYQDAIAGCTHKPFDAMSKNRFVMFRASNQVGKAMRDDELIPTLHDGFVRLDLLKEGQYIYGSDGNLCRITGIPYRGLERLYRITFDDGSVIECSGNHEWICKTSKERFVKTYKKGDKVWSNPSYNKWTVLNTKDIIKRGGYSPMSKGNWSKVSIPVCEPVDYPKKNLVIDPYVLGAMLGDAYLPYCSLSCGDKYVIDRVHSIYGGNINHTDKSKYVLHVPVRDKIRKLDLLDCRSDTKFIPHDYLMSSIDDRLSLLRGLMDTDGSIYGKNTVEYSTVSDRLKDDFLELIHSLGGIVNNIKHKPSFYYDKDRNKVPCKNAWVISFKIRVNPFSLERKAKLWKKDIRYRHERIIEKIELLREEQPVRCLSVDSPDNSFLVSNQYIVTHNSRHLVSNAIYLTQTMDNINVIMISKSLPQSQFLLATIRHVLNNSVFGGTWREDVGETANTTQLTFSRNNGKVINRIICAPAGEGTLGYPVHYMFLDEADFYEDAKKFFWKVALPRTNFTKGQIVIFSNPNPDIARTDSLLWDLSCGDLFKRKFHFKFLDAPWNTQDEYEMVRKSSPSYIFASTHDGDFPIDSGGFFTQLEINDMLQRDWKNELPIVDRPVYIGLDVAKVRDRTVLTLGTLHENKEDKKLSDLHVRYMCHFPLKMDYDLVVDKVASIVDYYTKNHHGVARLGYDATGVGNAIGDMLRNKGIFAQPITFSIQSKSKMYANFKILAEQRRIKIVYDEDCKNQLSNLIFARTTSGQLSIKHSKEDVHDDFPDSLCCLIDVSVVPSRVGVTATFVGNGMTKESNPDDKDNLDTDNGKVNNKVDNVSINDVHKEQIMKHRKSYSSAYGGNFFDGGFE